MAESFYDFQISGLEKTSFSYTEKENGTVKVALVGSYLGVVAEFDNSISPKGKLSVNYQTSGVPNGFLRETGLSFDLSDAIQHLDWKRKGYWNYYPEGEFAGNEGRTSLYQSRQAAYGEQPVQAWQADTHNYYYWADAGANCKQPLTQMAKGDEREYLLLFTFNGNRFQTSGIGGFRRCFCGLPDKQTCRRAIDFIHK